MVSNLCFAQPIKSEVKKDGIHYQLYRDGKPYYIKGAGGHRYLDRLVQYGGNSIRTWSVENAKATLDEAHKHGLTVMMGLWVQHERHGFDYDDEEKVAEQLEKFRIAVEELKDHPALLIWAVGNEVDLFYSNTKVWNAVQDIGKMIHEVDPNHPTTTVTAGLDSLEVELIKANCPDIDIYSVNCYGDAPTIPSRIKKYGWTGPYMITEWGPNGHWEVAKTKWEAPFEQSSTEKAASYRERHQIIMNDSLQCIGSYVFVWGDKQERTPTWYGIFQKTGEETRVLDMLQLGWNGKLPSNQAPTTGPLTLQNQTAPKSIYVDPSVLINATITASDKDSDNLMYDWVVMEESKSNKSGGDKEQIPPVVNGLNMKIDKGNLTFTSPSKTGAYRLFVYVYDGNNNVATANIPFYVN